MLRLLLVLFASFLFSAVGASWYWYQHCKKQLVVKRPVTVPVLPTEEKLFNTARAAKLFTRQNAFNTQVCFLVNMTLESGQNRFFVYNLQKDSVVKKGLVTHGSCNEAWLKGRRYGNQPGCGCTSLGKYKIGASYYGQFGLAFKLAGLDSTNSNAYRRFVVLHSHDCVPAVEVYPKQICQSLGCPTVSPLFLKELQSIISNSPKPVLLWVFE